MDDSTTGSTMFTPATEVTIPGDTWDGYIHETPWPGKTLMILEHGTRRAMALSEDGTVILKDVQEGSTDNCHWLCVEEKGFFGLVHPHTGNYMGYGNGWELRATAGHHLLWEFLIIRKHPGGGFQILGPSLAGPSLRIVCVAEDGVHLTFRQHGSTVWDFVRA